MIIKIPRIIFTFFICALFFFPDLVRANGVLNKKYIGVFIYTRDTNAGAAMAVHLIKKSLPEALSGIYSSHIYDANSIGKFFKGNEVSRENFNTMVKNYPNLDYFVTARLYYRGNDLNPNSNLQVRLSIYSAKDRVKRAERFFIQAAISNYGQIINSICARASTTAKEAWIPIPFSIISVNSAMHYARGRYFYDINDYAKASLSFRQAVDNLENINWGIINFYAESIIKNNTDFIGLKNPGENSSALELAGAVYFSKKENYERAIAHIQAFKEKSKNSNNVFQNVSKDKKIIFGDNFFALYDKNNISVINKNDISQIQNFKINETIENVVFLKDYIVINNTVYDFKENFSVLDKVVLIHEEPVTVILQKENNGYVFIHNKKGIINNLKSSIPSKIMIKYKNPLYIVTSGKDVYVFGRISGRLLWSKTLEYEVIDITPIDNQVIIHGKNRITYFMIDTGRVIREKEYREAEKIFANHNTICIIYSKKIEYEDLRTGVKWHKDFSTLNIIDVEISHFGLNVIVTDNKTVSYRFALNTNGREIYRELVYGKLISANFLSRIFAFNGYIVKTPLNRNIELAEKIHIFLSDIYAKTGNKKLKYENIFYALNTNPISFEVLEKIKALTEKEMDLTESEIFLNAFRQVFSYKINSNIDQNLIKNMVYSFAIYPFYKDGYYEILKTLGYKVPRKILSLKIGSILSYSVFNEKFIANYDNTRIEVRNVNTGEQLWAMDNFHFIENISEANNLFLYNHEDKLLILVDPKNGSPVWTNILNEKYNKNAKFLILNEKIYVFVEDQQKTFLTEINIKNGQKINFYEIDGKFWFNEKFIYIFSNGLFTKKQPDSLNKIWERKFKDNWKEIKFFQNSIGIIYEKEIIIINENNGNIIKSISLTDKTVLKDIDDDGNVYLIEKSESGDLVIIRHYKDSSQKEKLTFNDYKKIVIKKDYIFLLGENFIEIISKDELKRIKIFSLNIKSLKYQNGSYFFITNDLIIICDEKFNQINVSFNIKSYKFGIYFYCGGILSLDLL